MMANASKVPHNLEPEAFNPSEICSNKVAVWDKLKDILRMCWEPEFISCHISQAPASSGLFLLMFTGTFRVL